MAAYITYDGPEKIIKRLVDNSNDFVDAGGGAVHYPRLTIDSGGYIAVDYGPEEVDTSG